MNPTERELAEAVVPGADGTRQTLPVATVSRSGGGHDRLRFRSIEAEPVTACRDSTDHTAEGGGNVVLDRLGVADVVVRRVRS